MERNTRSIGVYVGRFNPVHLGHKKVIDTMIKDCGYDDSIIVVGSQNHPMTFRYYFSFLERVSFLEKLYKDIAIIGLPDFDRDDDLWIDTLDWTVKRMLHISSDDKVEFVYYSGCEEEVMFFIERGRKVRILNRFDGTTPKVSATEVRNALDKGRSLKKLLPSEIIQDVTEVFSEKWEKFKTL